MSANIAEFFGRVDDAPPPGVQPMRVARRVLKVVGPYSCSMETSCTSGPGSVRISVCDERTGEEHVTRFQADHWREAQGEFDGLVRLCTQEFGGYGARVVGGGTH